MLSRRCMSLYSLVQSVSRLARRPESSTLRLVDLLLSNPGSVCRVDSRIPLVRTGHQATYSCTHLLWPLAWWRTKVKTQEYCLPM